MKKYFTKFLQGNKLFLCSRDIKVGDKVWLIDIYGKLVEGTFVEEVIEEGFPCWWFNTGTKDLSSYHPGFDENIHPFKAIKELDASCCIKNEGMEFDEEQVRIYYTGDFESLYLLNETEKQELLKRQPDLKFEVEKVTIACPYCGIFS